MYLTIHSTAALVLAQYAPNPWAAFLIGVASHIILDSIPHGDESSEKLTDQQALRRLIKAASIDGLILLVILMWYYQMDYFLFTAISITAVLGAILPDALMGLHIITKVHWLDKISYWHKKIHNPMKYYLGNIKGLILQALVLIATITFFH